MCSRPILAGLSPFRPALIERLSESLNIRVIMRNQYDNIEKYFCQLVLLRPKLIVINIGICKVTGHIPGPGNNFRVPQAYKKNVSIIYWPLTV